MKQSHSQLAVNKYEAWADSYEADVTRMQWRAPTEVRNTLIPHVEDNQRIYEVGIGSGYLARLFLDKVDVDYAGCDISPRMLTKCFNAGGIPYENLSLVDLNNENIPEPNGSFNYIISCAVLEYVENIRHALGEMARLASSGSHLAFAYEGNMEARSKIVQGKDFDYFHHSALDVEAILAECGVECKDHYGFQSVGNGNPIFYTLYHGMKV